MRKKLTHALAAALALFIAAPAIADGPGDAGPDQAAPPVRAQPIPPSANQAPPQGQTGAVALEDVVLNVPAGYVFYPASEALSYLQRTSASTPPGAVLGLIARQGVNVRQPGVWATVLSYDAIGYVQPATASGLEDANFEASVREARTGQNRPFEGFATEPAFYADTARVNWAERSAAPGSQGPDLRVEEKALGRYGVACLTTIGSADQQGDILIAGNALSAMLGFAEGRRHQDFDAAGDQVSAYTVPGVVTGVAQQTETATVADSGQTGFGGLAGWFPWIAVGAIGLGIAGYMLMRGRRNEEEA